MAMKSSDGLAPNVSDLQNETAPVIRATASPGNPARRPEVSLLLVAWIGSLVIHGLLLSLFLLVTINLGNANVPTETEVIQTLVDDDKKDANLTNDEEGLNPDQLLNYDIPRIEDHSVPGPVNPAEAVGIKDAPEGPIVNVPPPAGLGGNTGQ